MIKLIITAGLLYVISSASFFGIAQVGGMIARACL